MNHFYLALSCLQGRTMESAFIELSQLPCTGIQLTPGNVPTVGFQKLVETSGKESIRHHGFSFDAMRQRVWDKEECLVDSNSVHPPQDEIFSEKLLREYQGPVLETMYPGYRLGTGRSIEFYMSLGKPLAVDVAHLKIQMDMGVLDDKQLNKIFDYNNITEIHVSESSNGKDVHRPLSEKSFGLEWAREKRQRDIPVVLECYMHKLNDDQRREQIELII